MVSEPITFRTTLKLRFPSTECAQGLNRLKRRKATARTLIFEVAGGGASRREDPTAAANLSAKQRQHLARELIGLRNHRVAGLLQDLRA
mgnify:FL=1